ncbi:MAG TPA: SLBB domain-containing protein [Blastocatellia bacterium]|nr:SLBB domain-containing protein [Blastocatellia bacterium]
MRVLNPTSLFLLFSFSCLTVCWTARPTQAQETSEKDVPKSATASPTLAQTPVKTEDERYRIGPGDLLEIRVFNRPQLSREAVRVDARGMIRMPLIEEEILSACQTEGELAQEIARRYRKYQRNPQVDVFIKEYNSQPVAVIGAVDKPGKFQLQRRVRLLELLSSAGGPTDKAGKRIQVAHVGRSHNVCQPAATTAPATPDQEEDTDYDIFNLNETMRGDEKANPYIQPGDIISVPEAEQAFVVGNVFKPAAIPLREPTTVSEAIAMAGGTLPDTKTDKIRVIRKVSGASEKIELTVNLQDIVRKKSADLLLQPGDIVEVSVSGGKRFLRNIYNAMGPALSNMPIYVIR